MRRDSVNQGHLRFKDEAAKVFPPLPQPLTGCWALAHGCIAHGCTRVACFHLLACAACLHFLASTPVLHQGIKGGRRWLVPDATDVYAPERLGGLGRRAGTTAEPRGNQSRRDRPRKGPPTTKCFRALCDFVAKPTLYFSTPFIT